MIALTDFKENTIPVSWKTIYIGRKLNLINSNFIEDFATQYLIEHYKLDNINIIELAYGLKDDFEINDRLEKLLKELNIKIEENSPEREIEKRKWRFIKLQSLLYKNYCNSELIDAIENVYCDFDHPSEMNEFLIYMPPAFDDEYSFDNHSVEENLAHIIQRFRNFLVKEQLELSQY